MKLCRILIDDNDSNNKAEKVPQFLLYMYIHKLDIRI